MTLHLLRDLSPAERIRHLKSTRRFVSVPIDLGSTDYPKDITRLHDCESESCWTLLHDGRLVAIDADGYYMQRYPSSPAVLMWASKAEPFNWISIDYLSK